jgi:hypothetical protein
VAGETVPAQGSTEATQDFVLEGEALDVQISHYTCVEENYGGTHYCPGGSLTASGVPVAPGVVACDKAWMGDRLVVGGFPVTCADTGSAVHAPIIDWWCYSQLCYDEGCTAPCPHPCEKIVGGRCYAEARVVARAGRRPRES